MAEPKIVSAELLGPDDSSTPLTVAEFRKLERQGVQGVLENVLVTYDDGTQCRPYRFASVEPPDFSKPGVVLF